MILFLQYLAGGKRGGERYTFRLHSFLKRKYDTFPDKLPERSRPVGISNHARQSLRHVEENQPDLTVTDISSGIRDILAIRKAKGLGGKAMIVIQGQRLNHRMKNIPPVKSIVAKAERYLIESADIILANSRYLGDLAGSIAGSKATIIVANPGVDSAGDAFSMVDSPKHNGVKFELLYVGECSEVKGTRYLIEALEYLPDLNIRLSIVGDFSSKSRYCRKLLRKIKDIPQERIKLRGYLCKDELARFYNDTNIFVLPSLSEGYGIAMAEALAYGLPVVATRVAAIPEMIEDGVNGILVPPKDPKALAEAIRTLVEDPELARKMRQANLEKAKALPTWDDFEKTLERELIPAIERLLGPKAGRPENERDK